MTFPYDNKMYSLWSDRAQCCESEAFIPVTRNRPGHSELGQVAGVRWRVCAVESYLGSNPALYVPWNYVLTSQPQPTSTEWDGTGPVSRTVVRITQIAERSTGGQGGWIASCPPWTDKCLSSRCPTPPWSHWAMWGRTVLFCSQCSSKASRVQHRHQHYLGQWVWCPWEGSGKGKGRT